MKVVKKTDTVVIEFDLKDYALFMTMVGYCSIAAHQSKDTRALSLFSGFSKRFLEALPKELVEDGRRANITSNQKGHK